MAPPEQRLLEEMVAGLMPVLLWMRVAAAQRSLVTMSVVTLRCVPLLSMKVYRGVLGVQPSWAWMCLTIHSSAATGHVLGCPNQVWVIFSPFTQFFFGQCM